METLISDLKTPKKLNCAAISLKSSQNAIVSKVRVIVRVRPFLAREIASSNGTPVSCVSVLDSLPYSGDEVAVRLKDQATSRNEWYKLDAFFGEEDYNIGRIFEKEVRPLIAGILHGCNATVFAYGATGSGKTYTMQGTDEQPGLMPLAMSTVLSMCQTTGSTAEISYYEIYLDRCYDLLELKAQEISVLDDKEGQIHLRGSSSVPVNSMSEFHEVFSLGVQRRKVAHTGLNDVSSRSHGVLVISVSTPVDGQGASVTGKLNLIDLAGNEDNKRACNEGIRLQESGKIKQSLFALSNVIHALNNNKPRIPYRESKLTRILQDSLGGTSRALMVACLNPGEYEESVHTVSLAARSRHISNFVSTAQKQVTPKVKVDMEAKLHAWLESKGKTKSTLKTGLFGSPNYSRAHGSVSSLKKQAVHHGSTNVKANTNQAVPSAKDRLKSIPRRNLFSSLAVPKSPISGVCLQRFEDVKDCLSSSNETSTVTEDGCLSCNPIAHVSDLSQEPAVTEATDVQNESLFDGIMPKLRACHPDAEFNEEDKTSTTTSAIIQSPPSKSKAKNKSYQSPLRKALSPINSNLLTMPFDEISLRDLPFLESKTPTTPFVVTRDKFHDFGTPLDKFNIRSSNLKSCLAEEYIDFLNTASREELVEVKGIGSKRAEYIIELRETSPLKSLSDLEKIGLSSKQVHNMFTTAARGIFN